MPNIRSEPEVEPAANGALEDSASSGVFSADQASLRVREEFRAATEEYAGLLQERALRLTGNAADARDLVQDTLERALRALGRYQQGTSMRLWLLRIQFNLFIDECRRRSRTPVRELRETELELSAPEDPSSPVPWEDITSADVHAALADLEPRFREVYLLKVQGGLRYDEIATRLAIPVGTVATRLARARLKLRDILLEGRSAQGTAGGGP